MLILRKLAMQSKSARGLAAWDELKTHDQLEQLLLQKGGFGTIRRKERHDRPRRIQLVAKSRVYPSFVGTRYASKWMRMG